MHAQSSDLDIQIIHDIEHQAVLISCQHNAHEHHTVCVTPNASLTKKDFEDLNTRTHNNASSTEYRTTSSQDMDQSSPLEIVNLFRALITCVVVLLPLSIYLRIDSDRLSRH